MTTITRNRIHDRLDQLSSLRNGWHSGTGLAPTAAALHTAREKARDLGSAQYVVQATLDGGLEPVQATDTYFAVLPTGAIHAA
jgi:hypothetical protein